MKKHILLTTSLIATAINLFSASAEKRPNILLILADDLGYGDVACFRGDAEWKNYKSPPPEVLPPKTPNLDKLASEGRMLTAFYANCSVCSPTRAALMTGRYQHRTGVVNVLGQLGTAMTQIGEPFTGLPHSEITVAKLLKDNGYDTACFGKWHLGELDEHHPLDYGFDLYVGSGSGAGDNFSQKKPNGTSYFYRNREVVDAPGYWHTDVLADETITYINQPHNKPFFAYLALTTPHLPLLGPNDLELANAWDEKGTKGPRPDLHQAYVDVVEGMDAALGRIFQALEKSGLAENTLVIFTSDNGPVDTGSCAPFKGRKTWLYEGGPRVAFIARWPGKIPAASTSDVPAMTMDLFPTFAALAGAPLPTDRKIDGADLSAMLTDGTELASRMLFWEKPTGVHMNIFDLRRWAVRDGDWKLTLERTGKQPELYNLSVDPTESRNVADRFPEKVQTMEKAFLDWKKDVYSDCPYSLDDIIARLKAEGIIPAK